MRPPNEPRERTLGLLHAGISGGISLPQRQEVRDGRAHGGSNADGVRDGKAGSAMDAITAAIAKRTCHIIAYRFRLENERHARMALEIKGLRGKALQAGSMFDRLNRAYDKLLETGHAHADDVESLAPQIGGMQDDISFAVQTLGNSVGASNGSEKPEEPPEPVEGAVKDWAEHQIR